MLARFPAVVAALLVALVAPCALAGPQFAAPFVSYPAGDEPSFVAIGDLNGDGRPDLAVTNFSSNTVSVLLGTGGGSVGPPTAYPTGVGPKCVAIGDLDRDGKPDLVVA